MQVLAEAVIHNQPGHVCVYVCECVYAYECFFLCVCVCVHAEKINDINRALHITYIQECLSDHNILCDSLAPNNTLVPLPLHELIGYQACSQGREEGVGVVIKLKIPLDLVTTCIELTLPYSWSKSESYFGDTFRITVSQSASHHDHPNNY